MSTWVTTTLFAMLATAVEADQGDTVLMTLYHRRPPKVSEKTAVMLSPALLRNIKGFVSLSTFFLSEDMDISTTFSDLLTTEQSGDPPGPGQRATAELPTDRISRLPLPESDNKGTFVRFFSFPVSSNSPDDIVITGDGLVPVWRWVKPDSTYRKAGFWEAKLDEALEDGEWNGGKNLLVLVRGVAEAALRSMTAQGIRVIDLEERFSAEQFV
ncbi:hypothetical protein GE09DRAFT_325521 [Coniochaeta sp. 2T2.1]|nr:hypothetical protein GE09DRAFT_325521 [Coniochaeta sp. 2T2.1]